jgi:hypothetical protein
LVWGVKNLKQNILKKHFFVFSLAPLQAAYSPFFSSVAHVWVPGAKTTGPIVKKFGFS